MRIKSGNQRSLTAGKDKGSGLGSRKLLLPALGMALVAALAVVSWAVLSDNNPGGRPAAIAGLRTPDIHALKFDPATDRVLFFGHHNGLLRSNDGGYTWSPAVERMNFDAMGLAVAGNRLYIAGHDIFQVSTDGGGSWRAVTHNLPGTDIHGLAASPDNPDRLYAFVVGRGLFRSEDAGSTWEVLSPALPGDVLGLLAVVRSPETLYVSSVNGGLLTSMPGAADWTPMNAGLSSKRAMAVAGSASGGPLYAGTDEGLYRATASKLPWEKLPYPGRNAMAVAVSPTNPQVVVAVEGAGQGVGRVYRSEDGGMTWASG